jgi:hypothetical protein
MGFKRETTASSSAILPDALHSAAIRAPGTTEGSAPASPLPEALPLLQQCCCFLRVSSRARTAARGLLWAGSAPLRAADAQRWRAGRRRRRGGRSGERCRQQESRQTAPASQRSLSGWSRAHGRAGAQCEQQRLKQLTPLFRTHRALACSRLLALMLPLRPLERRGRRAALRVLASQSALPWLTASTGPA